MKKWVSLLFVAALMLCSNVGWTSAAAKLSANVQVPKLYLDGKALAAKVPPALVNSSVLVPIRTVAENLGYKVDYDTKKKQVSLKEGSTTILMTLNKAKASVNGKSVTMNEPPVIISDTTLIPLRFVGETMGLQIVWDNDSKSVYLFSDATTGNSGNPGSGTGSGTDTGTGTTPTPAPTPDDGGLVGIGDSGGIDGTDGTTGGATDGSANGDGTTPDPNTGGTVPEVIPAHLHQVRYEPEAVIITYEGLAAPAANVLTGPDRIVIDIPNADFSTDFAAGFSPGIIPDFTPILTGLPTPGQIMELPTAGHEMLTAVRYSQYQTNPKMARIVLDLNQKADFEISNSAATGELRIQLKKSSQPPVKTGYTVVLDAGHGGSDPGAPSITGKWEKDFNLTVVKKVQAILAKESKINLVLTRQGDTYPSLDDRINLANSLKADLFLSVHGNSYNPGVNGTETYYTHATSLDFAKILHKNSVAATGFKDNGVRTANFKVIKYTTMPAVLLEVGYLSNASNEKQMFNDAFQNRVAAAIAASIKQYFNLP
jgi:N-acetylmuramoyl-L-alanine amidase